MLEKPMFCNKILYKTSLKLSILKDNPIFAKWRHFGSLSIHSLGNW